MGVVRIDDGLLKSLKQQLRKEENRYKYSSITALINFIIHEKLKETGNAGSRGKSGK